MTRLRLILPFFFFAALIVALYFLLYRPSVQTPALSVPDKPLPEFSLPSLRNPATTVVTAQLKGKPALLNVWATWCVSCRIEHALLTRLAAQGVIIYGVNYKDSRKKALRWLDEQGNPYRLNISDTRGTLGIDLGVSGAPETFVLDREGIIHLHHAGALDTHVWEEKIRPVYTALMKRHHKDHLGGPSQQTTS